MQVSGEAEGYTWGKGGGVQTGKGMGVKGPGEGGGMYRPRRLGLIKVKLGREVSLQKLQFIETDSHFLVHKHITHTHSHTHHTHRHSQDTHTSNTYT